jgi:hypothetical protein
MGELSPSELWMGELSLSELWSALRHFYTPWELEEFTGGLSLARGQIIRWRASKTLSNGGGSEL